MRESRLSGSVEGVMSNHDSYSDSLVALYCLSSDSQHNPRLRSGAGRSIVTTEHSRASTRCSLSTCEIAYATEPLHGAGGGGRDVGNRLGADAEDFALVGFDY